MTNFFKMYRGHQQCCGLYAPRICSSAGPTGVACGIEKQLSPANFSRVALALVLAWVP